MKTIILGSRGSRLALWQAEHVRTLIQELPGAPRVEIRIISTQGDRIQDVPLSSLSGQAFFTKEIELALLDSRIDLAVHSMKDLETRMPAGLRVAAVPPREDPRDAFLSRDGIPFEELAPGARVGTSSLRRRALLARLYPQFCLQQLRGNVPTRIEKMQGGAYEGIILASAGVKRLKLEEHITQYLDPAAFLPAPAQGALALQIRSKDRETADWIEPLDHPPTRRATEAERALLSKAEGGCQLPLGAFAELIRPETLRLRAMISSPDGKDVVEDEISGAASNPTGLGEALAELMLHNGADAILEAMRRGSP